MIGRLFLLLLVPWCFSACAGLPNEQQVARRYAAEHRGREVVAVTTTTTGEPWQMRAQFHITYREDHHTQTDVVR